MLECKLNKRAGGANNNGQKDKTANYSQKNDVIQKNVIMHKLLSVN